MSHHNIKSPLAKISLPRSENYLARERLFIDLDQARQHKAVWISAPAGSGKTILASSYLLSRHFSLLWYQVDEGDMVLASFRYLVEGWSQMLAADYPRAILAL